MTPQSSLLVVIPVVSATFEDALLQSEQASGLLQRFVDVVRRSFAGAACRILTDCSLGERLADENGLPWTAVASPCMTSVRSQCGLSLDLEVARRWLQKNGPGGEVAVVSPRHPLIGEATLRTALSRLRDAGLQAVLSVAKPADHPCQFVRFSRISGLDFLHLLDTDPDLDGLALPEGFVATRPFPFFWTQEGRGAEAPGELFLLVPDRNHLGLHRLDAVPHGSLCPSVTLQKSGPCTARALFDPVWLGVGTRDLAGCILPWPGSRGGLCLRRTSSGLRFENHAPQVPGLALRLVLVERYGPQGMPQLDGPPPGPDGLALEEPSPDAPGYVCVFQTPPQDGTFDTMNAFRPRSGLWQTDPGSGLQVNVATGQHIFGRQAFPEIWRAAGAFFMVASDAGLSALAGPAPGMLGGHSLEGPEDLAVTRCFDLLRLEVLARMRLGPMPVPPAREKTSPLGKKLLSRAPAMSLAPSVPLDLVLSRTRLCGHILASGPETDLSGETTASLAREVEALQIRLRRHLVDEAVAASRDDPGLLASRRLLEAMLDLGPAPLTLIPRVPLHDLPQRLLAARPEASGPNVLALLLLQAARQGRSDLVSDLTAGLIGHDPGRLRVLFPVLWELRQLGANAAVEALTDWTGLPLYRSLTPWPQGFLHGANFLVSFGRLIEASHLGRDIEALQLKQSPMIDIQASFLMRTGRPQAALAVLRRQEVVVTSSSHNRTMQIVYALRSLWRLDEALAVLEEDGRQNGISPDNQIARMTLLAESGRFEEAAAVVADALEGLPERNTPSQAMIRHFSALTLRSLGDIPRAEELLRRSLADRPYLWFEYFELALTLAYAGRSDEAASIARQGIERNAFGNNCCSFLTWLLETGEPLPLGEARRAIQNGLYFFQPWRSLIPAWAVGVGAASLAARGRAVQGRAALRAALTPPAMLAPWNKTALRALLARDRSPASNGFSRAEADAFSRAAFPHLSDDGFERRTMVSMLLDLRGDGVAGRPTLVSAEERP